MDNITKGGNGMKFIHIADLHIGAKPDAAYPGSRTGERNTSKFS